MAKKTTQTAELFRNRIVGYGTKPADQFEANPLNYRKHPQRQRDAVNASLRELGWIGVVVENVQTGRLVDGHERVWQALRNNEDVPFIQVDLSEDEERLALAVFDPITGMAETDAAMLDELLRDVNTGEAALQELLAELAQGAGLYQDKTAGGDTEAQVNRAEELRQKWDVQPGQLWELGEHRLLCGDCTDAATVARVLDGERIDGLVTDPPYSSGGFTRGDRQGSTSEKYQSRRSDDTVQYVDFAGDNKDQRSWITWCHLWLSIWLRHSYEGSVLALFIDWRQLPALTDAVQSGGWLWRGIAVWDKTESTRPVIGRFRAQCEYLVWGSAGPLSVAESGPVFPGVCRQLVKAGDKLHLTQKPIEVGEWSLAMTKPGGIVADPFCGSGTTLLACENLGRRCRAVEIAPEYVAVALERWATHTGRTPTLLQGDM